MRTSRDSVSGVGCGRRVFGWAVVLIAAAVGRPAVGDQVRVNGIWIPQVEIVGVAEGRLHYIDPLGRDVRRPLDEIGGMRVDAFPDYARAMDLIAAGKDHAALPLLTEVRKSARGRVEWLANDAGMRLMAVLDRQGKGADAVSVFLELVGREADPVYLGSPPLASVAAMSAAQRKRLSEPLERAAARASGETRLQLNRLLATAATGSSPTPAPTPGSAPGSTPGSASAPGIAPAPAPGSAGALTPASSVAPTGSYPETAAVLLPDKLNRSEVGDLVASGRFAEAIERADGLLRQRAQPDLIYLKAMARLALAERSPRAEAYKDAALDFMRVVIYFPGSHYAAPALLETAYIHQALGLADDAARLYEEAGRVLDPEHDARYHQRYLRLIRESPTTPANP